jgi:hypothetical protein
MLKAPGSVDPTAGAEGAPPDGQASERGARLPSQPSPAPGPDAGHERTYSASHEVLFEATTPTGCDACGAPLPAPDEDDDGYGVPGRGVYLWTRGDGIYFEKAPLCASCAAAIGVTALARWEIEEEEG